MRRVIAFGAFDPLREGHRYFLQQAKELGDHLTVVVAHESAIRAYKGRESRQSEEERMAAIKEIDLVDEVLLGRKSADKYHILGEVDFDVVAMGYNQEPTIDEVREELEKKGKYNIPIMRCKPLISDIRPGDKPAIKDE